MAMLTSGGQPPSLIKGLVQHIGTGDAVFHSETEKQA